MNSLHLIKVEFRNFLSYGEQWCTVDLDNGISIIQGADINTSRSNGSGKSSFLETIPFALYGKTIKDIKKSDIVNRYNVSGCEVKLTIGIDDDIFMFHRGIKPNIFKVYKNDDMIPQPSTTTLFQDEMEESIIGMDFKTFKNLIYYSPDNTISIIGAGKAEKRKFLESLFDLSVFSEMLKTTNNKLKTTGDIIDDLQNTVNSNTRMIDSHHNDINNTNLADIKKYKQSVNAIQMVLDALNDVEFDYSKELHSDVEKSLKSLNGDLSDDTTSLAVLEEKIKTLKETLSDTDKIDVIQSEKIEIDEQIVNLQDTLSESDEDFITQKKDIKKSIIDNKNKLDDYKDNLRDKTTDIGVLTNTISNLKDKKKEYSNNNTLDGIDQCPQCKQDVDHGLLDDYFNDKINTLDIEIDKETLKLKGYQEDKKDINNCIDDIKGNIKTDKDKLISIIGCIDDKNEIEDGIDILKTKLTNLPDIDQMKKDHKKVDKDIKGVDKEISDIKWKMEMTTTDIKNVEVDLQSHKDKKDIFDDHTTKVDKSTTDLQNAQDTLSEMTKVNKGIQDSLNKKKNEIKILTTENSDNTKTINLKNVLLDHLKYIKQSLQDDNIKQYAISSIVPYLNTRTNFYLSESGIPYVVDIDGWLNVTIKGLGVGEISYGSLSGGEAKSINMAVQFACADISENQSDMGMNFMLADEVIDSSLDDIGVALLMGVIRTRQKINDSDVFIITHRDELKDIDCDNTILVNKEDGFSSIE